MKAEGAPSTTETELGRRLAQLAHCVRLATSPRPGGGRCLLLARDVATGETVYEETALLCTTPRRAAAMRLEAAVLLRRRGRSQQPFAALALDRDDALVVAAGLTEALLGVWVRDLYPANAAAVTPALTLPRLSEVLHHNGAELHFGPKPLTALFLVFSMTNHSCDPSVAWSSSWDRTTGTPRVRVFATRALRAGDELTFSYVRASDNRAARLAELRAGWGFVCDCTRCSISAGDDTKLLRCSSCGKGAIALGGSADHCDACGNALSFEGGSAAALSRRGDVHFLDAEGNPSRVRDAIDLLHPRDGSLRAALFSLAAEAIADCEGQDERRRPCACRARLALEMAACLRLGIETSGYLPLDFRRASGALLEAEAACVAGLSVHDLCCNTAVDKVAALQRARACFTDAAAATESPLSELLAAATLAPPASSRALRSLRAARAAIEESAERAATGGMSPEIWGRLWPSESI